MSNSMNDIEQKAISESTQMATDFIKSAKKAASWRHKNRIDALIQSITLRLNQSINQTEGH